MSKIFDNKTKLITTILLGIIIVIFLISAYIPFIYFDGFKNLNGNEKYTFNSINQLSIGSISYYKLSIMPDLALVIMLILFTLLFNISKKENIAKIIYLITFILMTIMLFNSISVFTYLYITKYFVGVGFIFYILGYLAFLAVGILNICDHFNTIKMDNVPEHKFKTENYLKALNSLKDDKTITENEFLRKKVEIINNTNLSFGNEIDLLNLLIESKDKLDNKSITNEEFLEIKKSILCNKN